MSIIAGYLFPHPPIILPEIGRGEEKKIEATTKAFMRASKEIANLNPDTFVFITPHSQNYLDYFSMASASVLTGDMKKFGVSNLNFDVERDDELSQKICSLGSLFNFPVGELGDSNYLDHGATVPLYFLNKENKGVKIVKIGVSGLPLIDHLFLGTIIERAALETGKRVVVIASGDLSHKCKKDGPYGFSQAGVDFDEKLIDILSRGDFEELLQMTREEIDEAAECGLNPIAVMLGALNKKEVAVELLSYENTFGVGYGIMSFIPKEEDIDRDYVIKHVLAEEKKIRESRINESIYVNLARRAVEHYVEHGKKIKTSEALPRELLEKRAATFVTLKINGALRGCIGTITPRHKSLAEEIISNAISACSADPRFNSVEEAELPKITYSVDVLSPIEDIQSKSELDPARYGVIVKYRGRQGLLLPMLEGVDTVEEQIRIALSKAGISADSNYSLSRFEVVRHS